MINPQLIRIFFLSFLLSVIYCNSVTLASPICKSSDSDSDGDGWGWENETSCKVEKSKSNSSKKAKPSNSGHLECKRTDSDPDGDGWGWENEMSCKVSSDNSNKKKSKIETSKNSNSKLNNTKNNTSNSSSHPECKRTDSDPDGDGWGWEDQASCKVYGLNKKNDATVADLPTILRATQKSTKPPVEPLRAKAKISAEKTPFENYGPLKVCESNLCTKDGKVVQLRGLSSHGIHWFPWDSCSTEKSMDMLAYDWQTDLFRIAMYVSSGKPQYKQYSFLNKEQHNIEAVNKYIEEVSKRGMYAIVDFHILSENPKKYTEHAKRFFKAIAEKNKDRENLIYEIANEPTNTTWKDMLSYSKEVIPVIRSIDKDAIIVVGTRQWSSFNHGDFMEVVNNPVKGDNIMYAFHAYAPDPSHQQKYLDVMVKASKHIPIFVTEWGTTDASGQHSHNDEWGDKYIKAMKEHNISWAYWNFSSDNGGSSIWKNNYCYQKNKDWSEANMKKSGLFIKKVFKDK